MDTIAERLAYLEAVIGADITQFRKGMRDIRNETGILSETMRGVSGLGRTLTFAYTTPLLVLGSTAVGVASDFDAAMKNINAIAGLTGDELDTLAQRTLEFGKTTRAGAIGSAEALYTVFSSGLVDVEQAFATMEIASMTAEAGLANVNTTTEALVGSMLAFGDTSAENAQRTSDALTQMVAIGVGSMENFANSIATVTPAAVGLGVSIEELYADVAFLTQQGFSAARATTALNSSFTALSKPTEAMSAAMSRLGAGGAADLIEQFGGVNEAMVALVETTDGSQEAINALFGNIRGSRAVSTFMNNLDAWRQSTLDFQETVEGATLRAWESQMESFAATSDKFKSAIQGLGIVIGQALFPVLTPALKGLTDFINGVSSANPKIIAMTVAFFGLTAAIPPLIWMFGSLASPIGLVMGALGALAAAFATDFAGIRTTVSNAVAGIVEDLLPLWDSITRFWEFLNGDAPQFQPIDIQGQQQVINSDDVIRVTEPKSLWQIYEDEGYADRFSWQEFMNEAEAGGWMGGVVTPDSPIRIAPEFEVVLPSTDPMLDALEYSDSVDPFNMIAERFGASEEVMTPFQLAMDNIGAEIQAEVTALWDETKLFIDEQAGSLLEGLASWFSPAEGADQATSGIYSAIRNLLHGNVIEAIGSVSPELEQAVRDFLNGGFVDGLSSDFPEIQAQLPIFWDEFSGWLIDTAIPAVSRAAGYIATTLGIQLWNGLKSLFGMGGEAGAGLGDAVVTPFAEGMTDAMTDAGMTSDMSAGGWADLVMSTLASALAVAAVGHYLLFGGVGASILFGIRMGMLGAQALYTLGATVVTGIMAATAKAAVAPVAATAAAPIAAAVGTTITAALTGIAISVSLGIALGALLYIIIPESWRQAIRDVAEDLIDGAFGEGTSDRWGENFANAIEEGTASVAEFMGMEDLAAALRGEAIDPMQRAWDEALGHLTLGSGEGIGASGFAIDFDTIDLTLPEDEIWRQIEDQINAQINDNELGMTFPNLSLDSMTPEQAAILQGLIDAAMLEAGLTVDVPIEPNFVTGSGSFGTDGGGTLPTMTDLLTGSNLGIEPITATVPVRIVPDGEVEATAETFQNMNMVAPEGTEVSLNGVNVVITEGLVNGMTAEEIQALYFTPLQDAWVAMFAAEGLMATTFGMFSTSVTAGWTDMDTGTNTFVDSVVERLPEASGIFETEAPRWTNALSPFIDVVTTAKNTVNELKSAIEALLNLEGELSISVTVQGTANGTLLSKGLDYVPYDEYPAILHKGERVMTAKENKAFMAGEDREMSVSAVLPRDVGSGGGSNTTIYVQSKVTVDSFIAEMKRRGYKIEK